jgi:hypothetical protein
MTPTNLRLAIAAMGNQRLKVRISGLSLVSLARSYTGMLDLMGSCIQMEKSCFRSIKGKPDNLPARADRLDLWVV